jgi:hypothetical protein
MTTPETAPQRPWQEVEADIAAAQELQDDVTSPEEGRELLGELNQLYDESNEAFKRQTETLSGSIPTEQIGTQSLASVQKAKRLSLEEAQKKREEYNVLMGNLDENGYHITR